MRLFDGRLIRHNQPGKDHPGQIVPDHLVVIHPEPIDPDRAFAVSHRPVGPSVVIDDTPAADRKYEPERREEYRRDLKVAYYLRFDLKGRKLTLFRLADEGCVGEAQPRPVGGGGRAGPAAGRAGRGEGVAVTDRDAILAAIRAAPDDDTPRLVYADWLDDHGHPEQAEFIRVQVELEPIRDRLDDPRTRELIRRADEFESRLNDPSAEWVVGFRRGLADRARVDIRTLRDRGSDLRAEYPTVRELAVVDSRGDAFDVAGCPALADLDTVELAFPISPGDAATLAECPHLARVGTLRLWIGWSERLAEAVAVARPQPARIELVQLLGGVSAGSRAAELDAEADALAARVNRLAGRDIAHVVRPFDRTFPLCGRGEDDRPGIDISGGMFAGRLPDGTPALVGSHYGDGWVLARFHEDGRLAEFGPLTLPSPPAAPSPPVPPAAPRPTGLRRLFSGMVLQPPPPPPPAPPPAPQIDFPSWLIAGLGLRPAAIVVREFDRLPWFRLALWPLSYFGLDGNWQADELTLYGWLKGENFDVGEYAADWRGRLGRPTYDD
ncbi:MAG: TIGR02996 domain-containing protein [Gemmataceae bacterium]|nr:TIGR02996 domain-containing protein [Gemmataceae bacterium]